MPKNNIPDGYIDVSDKYLKDSDSSIPEGYIDVTDKYLEPKEKSGILRRAVADPLVSVAKGVAVGIPEFAVGIADIPTMGYAGKLVDDALHATVGGGFEDAGKKFDTWLSPETQEAKRKVEEAKGFIPTVATALQNPSSIVSTISESAPSMVGGAGAGRLLMKLLGKAVTAKGITEAQRLARAIAAGSVGEGAVSAGQNTEQVRQSTESGLLTPEQVAATTASGIATGTISRLSAGLAKKLGVPDIDVLLAGADTATKMVGVKNKLKAAVGSMLTEGAFEELPQSAQEQLAQNIALGRPIFDGVAEAGAMGLLSGAGMGLAGTGLSIAKNKQRPVNQPAQPQQPPASPVPPAPVDDVLAGRQTIEQALSADVERYESGEISDDDLISNTANMIKTVNKPEVDVPIFDQEVDNGPLQTEAEVKPETLVQPEVIQPTPLSAPPEPAQGMIRLYRGTGAGAQAGASMESAGGWFTPNIEHAQKYVGSGALVYIDIPKKEAGKYYRGGIGKTEEYVLPNDIIAQAKLYQTTKADLPSAETVTEPSQAAPAPISELEAFNQSEQGKALAAARERREATEKHLVDNGYKIAKQPLSDKQASKLQGMGYKPFRLDDNGKLNVNPLGIWAKEPQPKKKTPPLKDRLSAIEGIDNKLKYLDDYEKKYPLSDEAKKKVAELRAGLRGEKKSEGNAPELSAKWDAMGYGQRQAIAQASTYGNMRAVVHRISGSKWDKLSKGEQEEIRKAMETLEANAKPVAPAVQDNKSVDLSTKSTSELVGDIFNIINDHIGKRGSVSNKPIALEESLYQKIKPYLIEIAGRAKAKALDARAYLFGAVDSMPEGQAKSLYEEAARKYVDEEDNAHYEKLSDKVVKETPVSAYGKVADNIAEKLKNKIKFTRNDLFEICDEAFGGTLAEGKYSAKDAYDAMEMGINKYIYYGMLSLPQTQKEAKNVIEGIKKLFDLIPTQTTRTAEMDEFQQFSTPPALAFAANWAANLNKNDVYLEPSAGTGNIATFAKVAGVKETIVNELAPRRAAILKELGFDKVFTENAEQINNILPADIKPTVVVMNPPFSSTAGRITGERKTSNATVHIEQCLKRLVPGGRLVAIVGEGMASDRPTFKPWFKKLSEDYILRANIGISGQEYVKYGTSFGNQILVIDKPLTPINIDNAHKESIIEVTGRVDKIEQLIDLLEGVRNERIDTGKRESVEQGKQESPASPETATGRNEPLLPATSGVVTGEQSGGPGRTANDNAGRNEGLETGERGEVSGNQSGNEGTGRSGTVDTGKKRPKRTSRSDTTDNTRQADNATSELSTEAVKSLDVKQQAEIEKHSDELSDSVYDTYRPAKLKIPGAKDHPGKLVESAAMASVDPIDPTYQPKLPSEAVKTGKISMAQLEAVVYAGQAHQDILPNETRKGFFIGDGTGVGKGREIASILWDNWNHGRKKAIWLSQNSPLMKDAERDIKGIGWNPHLIFDLGKAKLQGKISQKEGIGFIGYGTLRSKKIIQGSEISRLDQITEWLGNGFDGCIIFDESHNMGNALPIKGTRGTSKPSATALAGVELQKRLPNARIVYVSATGATEVMNLAYASRLGLWGHKTPFPDVNNFVTSISAGGITAMEMVAMNMKANGVYMARSLSYDDVKYERLEHNLSPEQSDIYNELAGAWQIAQSAIDSAMDLTNVTDPETGATLNTDAKSHIMAQFWGTNQRFWNQVITAMQMPSVIASIEKDVDAGHAPIIQLINTNEAAQERAIGRLEEEDTLEDLDITPKEMLMEYVKNSFPVYQFEVYEDEEGNKKSRLVKDSAGNPVLNQEAVERRDALLLKIGSIRVPDGPLEMILDHFGVDNVAEVTGRSRRVVYKQTPEGRQRVVESWGKNKGMSDADAFMDDRKKILIFSQAGGTGRSYHADRTAKNKRLRRHYLVQAGWRADVAVQGLGRSHRTNQEQAPEWVLVTTDLEGQKRFISSIARRLSQLGALTKGSRETGNQGLFNARDNLESQEAKDAFHQLLHDLYHNDVSGMTMGEFIDATGLNNILDKTTGALNVSQLPDITQFLNRILNMKIEQQNAIFGEFAKRLNMKVAQAIEKGTLDVGVETIRAKRTEKVGESVVYENPKTKARATYVEVELTHDAKLLKYEDSFQFNKHGYVQNIKSGRVWALAGMKSKTDARTGNIGINYAAVGANYNYHDIREEDLNNPEKYKKLDAGEAETLWSQDYDAAPKEVKERVHLITGTILPIWDRLPQEIAKIYRLQVDGRNMIGRVIDNKSLEGTLSKLGAQKKAQNFKPEDVFNNILNRGFAYTLSNDWTLQRRKVADDYRIEIKGPYYSHVSELSRYGVFTERINYDTRFFIPTEKETGINAIKEIISSRPIVNETGNIRKAGDVSITDAAFLNETNLYSGFDPTQTLNVLRGLRDNIREAIPHIEAVGNHLWESGKRTYDSWFIAMKRFLGDLWRSFKPLIRDVWKKIREERGSISFEKIGQNEPRPPIRERLEKLDKSVYPEQKDPPVSNDTKVLNLYLKDEAEALFNTIKNKLHPKNMTWLETILKSPEWFDHPQINKIVKYFTRDRNEIYHETFNYLNDADDVESPEMTVSEAGKLLKGKGLSLSERLAGKSSKEYDMLQRFLDYFDTSEKRNKNKSEEENLQDCEDYMRKNGATDDVVRVWRLYRQSYDKALDLQTQQLRDMIDNAREEALFRGEDPDAAIAELKETLDYALAEMEKWKGYYAPRIREQGEWKVQAYKEHGPLKANREYYRGHKPSELSAQRLANKLRREGWTVSSIDRVEKLPETIYQDVKAVAAAKLIDNAIEKVKSDNTAVASINAEILKAVADEIRARGFRSHMMHRANTVVKGYIEDPMERHILYTNQLSGGISKARTARMALKELLGEKFQGEQVGGIDPVKDPEAYKVATNYIEEQLRNLDASDRIIGLAKSIATFKFLGFNLRSLAVNTTAVITTAPAAIHQYALNGKGDMTKIMGELGRSGKDFGAYMAGRKLSNADEQALLDEMHKKGWDDPQYTRDALGKIGKAHSRAWETVMSASMYLFGQSEKWNRGTTVLAAYRLARKQGHNHADAAELAKEASDKAHGVYGRSTMPMWAQGSNPAAKIGQMAYTYTKFSHNYLQMLYDMGFKRKNIKAFAFAVLSPLVLAGGAALPFKDAIFGLFSAFFDRDPEKWVWDTIREHLGPDAERIGRHGLTGMAGLDISGSLSIGVGIPKNLMDLTGAIGGVIGDIGEAAENIGRGQYNKAVEQLLPAGIANPLKAYRESQEGVTTRNNRRVWAENGKPYTPGAAATAGRAFGFRSTDQAVLSERTWEGHREQTRFNDKRNAIYERYRAWLLGHGTSEEHKEIIQDVRKYNDSVKGVPGATRITFESLRDQAKRLQKPSKKERAILS